MEGGTGQHDSGGREEKIYACSVKEVVIACLASFVHFALGTVNRVHGHQCSAGVAVEREANKGRKRAENNSREATNPAKNLSSVSVISGLQDCCRWMNCSGTPKAHIPPHEHHPKLCDVRHAGVFQMLRNA